MVMQGRCEYTKCGSLCCKQFRLIYPPKTFIHPESIKGDRFLYPFEELVRITTMTRGNYALLMAWRNITVDVATKTYDGVLYATFILPRKTEWQSRHHEDGHVELIFPELRCSRLRANGTCTIHERKPAICKDFPRGPLEIPEGCGYRWSP